MKKYIYFTMVYSFCCVFLASGQTRKPSPVFNRTPLVEVPYARLPLGEIQPDGWLLEQLERMADGLTGHLDEVYTQVVGPRNGWLGGDGDGWERGPYWIDGLLPLAFILENEQLTAKVQPWIEWSIRHQQPDGYFGPIPFENPPKEEPGLQRGRRRDWWPKMVMLKVLCQYYMATGDQRVIDLLTNYFHYQMKQLPKTPLDHWSFWGNRRGGDNMMVVYWLYNITGDQFLLDLAELLCEQTYPYTQTFLDGEKLSSTHSFHCVNLAQGIKQPIIYYQQHPDQRHITAVKKAFRDIYKFHGQPQGMYGGDEPLHGKNPTQGSEFCSTVEMMFSLENMILITGDVQFCDQLELVTFNSLPVQANDDYTLRQYYQQPNQVMITWGYHNFFTDNPHRLVYGTTTGYPCCTTNMHQGWPKFTQHLWLASVDSGLAALNYAPCQVNTVLPGGEQVSFTENTRYPFEETIRFDYSGKSSLRFPLYLRIPGWCKQASVNINGVHWAQKKGGQIIRIKRVWQPGDQIELILPMSIETDRWYENSVRMKRGPLVYALKIDEEWRYTESKEHPPGYAEVYPTSPWNYGLSEEVISNPNQKITILKQAKNPDYPWNPENAPIELETTGIRIPSWQLYNNMAGPLPASPQRRLADMTEENISLIPYGCTVLRISEFPVIR